MKKIGDYTARGIVSEEETEAGIPQKIPLFDGRFDTGYRVTKFVVWSTSYNTSSNADVIGKLSKNEFGVTSAANFMRADDDNQIGWSGMAGSADSINANVFSLIDKDNLIVEDLYVYARTSGSGIAINYLVEMEKFEITEWRGALAMARDKAQE